MTHLSIKSVITHSVYERLRAYLQHTMPGGAPGTPQFGAVDDTLVDAFVSTLWKDYKPVYASLGIAPLTPELIDAGVGAVADDESAQPVSFAAGEEVTDPTRLPRYYLINSRHHRHGLSDFVGRLPMARVSLPTDETDYTIRTAIGDVLSTDHLLRNVREVNAKAYPCERVELITPVRRDNVRFAAIAVMLAYEKFSDQLPKYYILEAGLAQGGARMTYIAKDMQPIVRRADYEPTQFSSGHNFYHATLAMNGNEPSVLTIDSVTSDPRQNPSAQPYITITAEFIKTSESDTRIAIPPLQIYRQAVIRVAAVAEALGQKVADLSILQGMFAKDGRDLDWLTVPPSHPR